MGEEGESKDKKDEALFHTERVIDEFLDDNKRNRKLYNMYSYLAPCNSCKFGFTPSDPNELRKEKVRFQEEYKGTYHTHDESPGYETFAKQVKYDLLLKSSKGEGLTAIKEATKVDLNDVKKAINDGIAKKTPMEQIVDGIGEGYLKNAVESYLEQHLLWDNQ